MRSTLEHFGFQPAQVLADRAEQLRTAMRAFEIQLHIVFSGDRDTAVQLNAFGGHRAERLGGRDAGQRCRRR